jgi:lysophospholipase L1-like esterase
MRYLKRTTFLKEPVMLARLVCLLVLSCTVFAAAVRAEQARSPYAPVADDPALPRILIIGDSISIGYTLGVRDLLKGKANVHRPPTNCGPTTRGLEQLDAWLGTGTWDVIHFNWGLHDLKHCDDEGVLVAVGEGHQQVPVDQYSKNLEQLVLRLQRTGAVLIWRNTTPVPEGAKGRVPADVPLFNQAALAIMQKHGIPTQDMYSSVLPRMEQLMLPKDVHYNENGYQQLAKTVAAIIEEQLADRN